MDSNIIKLFSEFQAVNKECVDLTIGNKESILFKSESSKVDDNLYKKIINAWDNHDGAIQACDLRYIVLKSDPLQLACVKPGPGGKGLIGTSKGGIYSFSFIENGPNMNASSVYFQKWIVSLL